MTDDELFRAVDYARFHRIGLLEALGRLRHHNPLRRVSIAYTNDIRAAIAEYQAACKVFVPGRTSTLTYEIPQMHIGQAVLEELGLPTDPFVEDPTIKAGRRG